MSNLSIFVMPPNPMGNEPTILLPLTSNTDALASCVISSGKQPVSSLFEKMISSNVLPILLMLFGMQPFNLLLANTATETGELPRFSGMLDVNRLSFKNKASSSMSNNLGGNAPSKSLYLISRYFRAANPKTTSGKGPTKRLLLTSNSCRSQPVRINVEKADICQEPKFRDKVTGDVSVVKINTGDNAQAGVIKRLGTEDTIIGTHIRTNPISSHVQRVGEDGLFPFLESNVSSPEPGIGKGHANVDLVLEIIRKIASIFLKC
ncbi:hypothetical protein RJ639_018351 [Escallonia herrerae]|uniref:Uncharacterized protein n=1 Tax=Escallonia herrerae TaxID=1293975 RepID=A0AA88V9J7_9ASTE|nr:hypothetical protein RJ639_018351 [Escallonia herrerae]